MAMLTFYPRWSATATRSHPVPLLSLHSFKGVILVRSSEFGKFEQLPVDFGGVLAAGIHAKCLVLVLPWLSEVLLLVDATSVSRLTPLIVL